MANLLDFDLRHLVVSFCMGIYVIKHCDTEYFDT